MIHSPKLDEFFKNHNPEKLHYFLKDVFGYTYTKTYSDCGLYTWLGATRQEFDNNLGIDRNAPMAYVYQKWEPRPPTTEWRSSEPPVILYIFINHTEDQVIDKFNRYQRLKAFL